MLRRAARIPAAVPVAFGCGRCKLGLDLGELRGGDRKPPVALRSGLAQIGKHVVLRCCTRFGTAAAHRKVGGGNSKYGGDNGDQQGSFHEVSSEFLGT